MMEHIYNDQCVETIISVAYQAGSQGKEVYTIRGADGEEIIRCRDCAHARQSKDGSLACGVFKHCMYETDPNGYCYRAVREDER